MTLHCFFPCHLSSLHSPCCADSQPCCSCWAFALLALACWLLPFICAERERLTLLTRVLQTSPITRVQQTDSPPWHFIQPTYPPRVSNPNSLPAHNVPVLPGSTQPPSCLLPAHTSTWGMTFSPRGCRIHWVEGKQCLQQPFLMVQSRTLPWAGWQLSEMTQISAPLQAQKTCCLARLASSSPAQLFCPQHHHRLHSCQSPRLLTHQRPTLPQGTWIHLGREGGCAVQEAAACGHGRRRGSCSVTPVDHPSC